ncbi:nuclear pore complex protein Nup153 isoform X2 [Colossoma macropomum]|uniref:nuclear pore complex protein Nup153 isoform X2 n=1 Tax=Colossoma macropomum TaxID=42526 RepID=UPI0018654BD6|nr:nuclear pore complex protein Nup153 isoform X2 [Colossoma macropomum]
MAATGGGKIRTRRYHIVSKPYAKGKQPGLISRVTDTVKSIVPSWLQKYFKNGELTESGEARVEVEQNNVAPPPNGSEETVPLRDGRNSPEPSTSNAEPSTSRASLNFQDVLSRPPLNRSHLHFPSQDGSPALGGSNSLFSQPSTSTAPFPASPFAVASSFSLVKEIKDSSSQHEDDNISTTSGFSSRASDKDVPTSKTAPLLWSPETERTHSGSQPAQHSLKKPAFNLSVFGTSSSSAMNSSVLNSSQLGDSPFYPGKTTYGGAAAARTARARPGTPYQAPVRRQIKAKPAGAQPCGVTSATARRILQSLERMSSPLADAKRIPSTVSSPLSTLLNHTDPDVSPFQSKKKKLEPAVPPVQKLVIPAAAAVTGNRSMSFRPSLTPGSVSRTVEKSVKETPVRRSPKIPDAASAPPPSTSSLSYPLSSTPATISTGGGGGKMKRERSVRPSSRKPDDEVAEVPELPAISLPISNFTLPTFSFSSPPPTSTLTPSSKPLTSVLEEPAVSKEASPGSMAPVLPFVFSSPIVKATAASPTSFSPSSGFTFSAPTMKTAPSASNGNPVTTVAVKAAASESKEEFEGPFKPAKALKQGSVLDILKGPGFASPAQSSSVPDRTLHSAREGASSTAFSGFKPAPESWNCDASVAQNKSSDKESVACLAPQPNTESSSKLDSKPAKAPAASLTSLFAPPPGSWECDTCLVRNKPEVVKCVACDTAKPGTGVKPTLTLPPVSEISSTICAPSSSATTTTSTSTTSGPLGFGDKFKKPEGAWDCDVCMVQNKAQDIKCVACQNAKPGTAAVAPSSLAPAPKTASSAPLLGFGDKFKKPEGSWECDVCSVQNKAEDQQCVACQSAKPGAKVESKGFGSSFGTQSSSTESASSSFKFGTSSSNTTSSGLKFGGTFSNSSNSVGFQMGNDSSDSTTSSASFKFGASSSDTSGGFKFGGSLTEPASTGMGSSGGFKFGGSSDGFKFGTASAPVSTSEEKKSESQNSSIGFKFGGSSGVAIGSGAASTSTTTVSGGFSFGLSKPEEKAASNSTFNFSAPKVKGDKDDAPSSIEAVSAASTTSTAVANTIPVFGKPPAAEPSKAAPSFGEAAAKEPALATPAFTFGKPEEKKDTSTPSTGFVFSAAKEADKPAPSLGFSFSKPEPPKELPKSTFTFGKPAESTETPKPAFGFGHNATDTAAPKPAFGFMANSSSTPASSSPAPSLFGTQSSSTPAPAPTPAPTSTFIFGQSSSSDAPPAKTLLFGQQQDSQPASAALPAAPAPAQPFLFGQATNSATFSFGAAAATTPASAAPAPSAAPSPFVFTSATSSSGFGFGQTPAFGQGSSQTSAPAFGSAAPSFSATASPAPAFGAKPSAAPAFGQQPNSTPVFGSSSASSGQGGFQFGGASAFGTSARNSSEFSFGGSGTAASSAPSMSTQPVAPGGGFNFTQAPAFNIGATKNAFSPTPTGQHGIAGRKIKTAVRRRK